jgi:hypothetical protein
MDVVKGFIILTPETVYDPVAMGLPPVTCAVFIQSVSQGGLTSGRQPVVKIIAESLSQYDEKNVVPTPLSHLVG